MKRKKGSFTVEMSLLVPVLLFIMAHCIYTGIAFFQDIKMKESPDTAFWAVEGFYLDQGIGEVFTDGS